MVILDNGHGGLVCSKYQTPGKRSPEYNGEVLYEGVFTRFIVAGIAKELVRLNIPCHVLVPENEDVKLRDRVNRANVFGKNSLLVSVHANAGGGSGCEFWTSPGRTKADDFANMIAESYVDEFPGMKLRADYSDGDADKESSFYLLKHTVMPACITENFFMDNEEECVHILQNGVECLRIISYHVEAIQKYYQQYLL